MLVNGWDRVVRLAESTTDKVKDAAEDFSDRVSRDFGSGPAVDYSAMVDKNEEGYRFRRDLPFPSWVVVDESRTMEVVDGRALGDSATGVDSARLAGKFEGRYRVAIGSGRVECRVERLGFQPNFLEAARDRKSGGVPESLAGVLMTGLEGKAVQFGWDGCAWRMVADSGDGEFLSRAWGDDLKRDLPVLLAASGLMPRSMWFGGRRMKVGDQMTLQGRQVSMLTGHSAEGDVSLTFDRVESLQGHPCGVFRWSGKVAAANVPSLCGPPEDIKLTVSEGRTWMSLVHPVVLRGELQAYREVKAKTGAASIRWQGETRETVERRWRADN